jgi:hypothetical protein
LSQQLQAERKRCAAAAMSHPTEIADADECRRQHVQQESSQELVNRQRHQTLLVVVSRIAPAKSDQAISHANESMVGNRHTMGVLAEIT